jgi:hypothetical protein
MNKVLKNRPTSQRFELWRAKPSRFLIYLLNHSDTMSCMEERLCIQIKFWVSGLIESSRIARVTHITWMVHLHTTP